MALTDSEDIKQSNLVSVIIPCYNHEKFIQTTLDSIARDTYPYKEIILINDGSSDDSDQKITEWISSNNNEIKITYVNRKNKGICSTLNELIGIAKGKYILPLASDDCLYGNAIAQRVSVLESSPGKYVLLNDAYVIDENDKIIMDSSADYWRSLHPPRARCCCESVACPRCSGAAR